MKDFVKSGNVGMKFGRGVGFLGENEWKVNNILYFDWRKEFGLGKKGIKGCVFGNICFWF